MGNNDEDDYDDSLDDEDDNDGIVNMSYFMYNRCSIKDLLMFTSHCCLKTF